MVDPKYIDTTQALEIIAKSNRGEVSNTAFYRWIRQYRLGKKVFGRWVVDKEKLEFFLNHGTGGYDE